MANIELWRNNWGPFRELMSLSKSIDRMMEDWPMAKTDIDKYNFNPSCEVREDNKAYVLKVDLPGVPKENIKIDLNENRLTLRGDRKEEKKTDEKETQTHFSEMFYGSFTRTMTFPAPIDAEKTEAHYENGVLTLKLPKKATQNIRQITIN